MCTTNTYYQSIYHYVLYLNLFCVYGGANQQLKNLDLDSWSKILLTRIRIGSTVDKKTDTLFFSQKNKKTYRNLKTKANKHAKTFKH